MKHSKKNKSFGRLFFTTLAKTTAWIITAFLLTLTISYFIITFKNFYHSYNDTNLKIEKIENAGIYIADITQKYNWHKENVYIKFLHYKGNIQQFQTINTLLDKRLVEYRNFIITYVQDLDSCQLIKDIDSNTINQINKNKRIMEVLIENNHIPEAYSIFTKTDKLRIQLQTEAQLKSKFDNLKLAFQYIQENNIQSSVYKKYHNILFSIDNTHVLENQDLINQIDTSFIEELEQEKEQFEVSSSQINKKIKNMKLICSIYHCPDIKEINAVNLTRYPSFFEKFLNQALYYEQLKTNYDNYAISRGSWKSNKRILVSTSRQHMYLIENYDLYTDFPASTGRYGAATATGEFKVWEKLGTVYGIYDIWMPYWMTIYFVGDATNVIHGIPIGVDGVRWSDWERYVGIQPMTVGCVMPRDKDAKTVYNWAEVGTPVSIVW